MKKETWLTAVIFLGAGFLAGFAFNAHQNSLHRREAAGGAAVAASAAASQSSATPASGAPNGSLTPGQDLPRGHPPDVDARTDMATCLFNMGRTQQAVDELQKALKMDPHHEATLFNLAVVNLDGTHNLRAADDALKQLRTINPGYPGLDQLQQAVKAAGAPASAGAASP